MTAPRPLGSLGLRRPRRCRKAEIEPYDNSAITKIYVYDLSRRAHRLGSMPIGRVERSGG